ncbi:hypothetical protein [Nocardioides sp. P5_E3]
MAAWQDVEEIALGLAGARPALSHGGDPTIEVGRHPFARLRWDDEGRELLQFWSLDLDSEAALADRGDTFVRVDTFKVKVSVWARLDLLDRTELTEVLTDSWKARRGVRG